MYKSRKCPDCGEKIYFNPNLGLWAHKDLKCAYMENEKGERIWDNAKRENCLKSVRDIISIRKKGTISEQEK